MIRDKLNEEIKTAMRSGEKIRLGTLRVLLSAVKDFEINNRVTATEADVLAIFRKGIKTRKDSIEEFRKGGRLDSIATEENEIKIIEEFMPAAPSDAEILAAVDAAIAEVQAKSIKDMGRVMKIVSAKLEGRADGGVVSGHVKERLARLSSPA